MKTFLIENALGLGGVLGALLLHALFVACELGLIKIRFSHFDPDLRQAVESRKSLQRLLENGDRTIRVIRLGLSVCLILYAILIFPLLLEFSALLLPFLDPRVHVLLIFLAFLFALMVHHFVAELIPRAVGLDYPIQTLKAGWVLIAVLGWVTRPIRHFLGWIVRFGWNSITGRSMPDLDSLDLEAQLELIQKEAPDVSAVGQLIMRNAMYLKDLVVADILLPRNQVKYFDLNLSLEENIEMARETGHTRFPLCFGDLDRCLGLIHIKDIFRFPGAREELDLRKVKRNILRIDSEEPIESALSLLLTQKVHMALVVDEFRGTEGVLTLERILEQLVGDIRDEFDVDEETLIQPSQESGEVVVAGITPLHEIEDILSLDIDAEEVSTVSGLITSELGRIPDVGETLISHGLEIEVLEVDETRVLSARIQVLKESDEDESEDVASGYS